MTDENNAANIYNKGKKDRDPKIKKTMFSSEGETVLITDYISTEGLNSLKQKGFEVRFVMTEEVNGETMIALHIKREGKNNDRV